MTSLIPDKIRIPDALWEGLKRVNVAQLEVLRLARLPISVLRDGAPVSTSQFFKLWTAILDVSTDPSVGIQISLQLKEGVLPLSMLVAYHARTFHDALMRVARFKRLCAPEEIVLETLDDKSLIVVNWIHAGEQAPSALVDATFASLVELGRRGTASALAPVLVELARPDAARLFYENYYGCAVKFDADKDRIAFSADTLSSPFVQYNAELLEIVMPALELRLQQAVNSATVVDQVRWVLQRRLTAGRPDIGSVASELAISLRSLQRKLTDEGFTFQELLSDTRHKLALGYLSSPTVPLGEVAYMLGYEDQNSFFRAFRQWENQTPSGWRANYDLSRR